MSLDIQVSRNLREGGIVTRSTKNNGLWCYMLLPMILIMYTILYKMSVQYHIISFVSVGLFFYCMLLILFLSISSVILKEFDFGGCMASSLISTLLIYIFLGKDLLTSLVSALSCIYFFNALLKICVINLPKTFTIGEAMVISQSIILFVTASIIEFLNGFVNGIDEESTFINTLVFTVLSTMGLIVTALFLLNDNYKNVKSLGYIITIGAVIMLLEWHLIMGRKCIIRIIAYIFMDFKRVKLLIIWLSMVIIAVFVIFIQTKMATKASTVTRKTFHVLACLVFLSGILTDISLMTLAAGIGLALLIFTEALRICGIEPISSALHSAFLVYSDEKDSGVLAMTPLYLFTGLACPLILAPSEAKLDLLAGVLAIGVGDTAASCIGSTFGKTHWADSNRTLEGTAANILSQVAVICMLQYFELLETKNAVIRTLIAATASALVEAKTDQVDNLILPLVTIIAFQVTCFLS
ncbi:unnamed protein product [Parnassius apollo]|uniref:dolichol kinase n=1 Tax=Parnassius apollo TaxID=110799 RepID=A0A8S3YAD0_PARAO|nr:unnamed protein product [Parnassius apollo]